MNGAASNRLADKGYDHDTIDHGKEEWVYGDTHVNTLEAFWSQLKHSISGTQVHVSKKYFGNYLGEFEFPYNLRQSETVMFPHLLASPWPQNPTGDRGFLPDQQKRDRKDVVV